VRKKFLVRLALGDEGGEGDVVLVFHVFVPYVAEFVSFVTYHSRATIQGLKLVGALVVVWFLVRPWI
jgi:hypothetical protein